VVSERERGGGEEERRRGGPIVFPLFPTLWDQQYYTFDLRIRVSIYHPNAITIGRYNFTILKYYHYIARYTIRILK